MKHLRSGIIALFIVLGLVLSGCDNPAVSDAVNNLLGGEKGGDENPIYTGTALLSYNSYVVTGTENVPGKEPGVVGWKFVDEGLDNSILEGLGPDDFTWDNTTHSYFLWGHTNSVFDHYEFKNGDVVDTSVYGDPVPDGTKFYVTKTTNEPQETGKYTYANGDYVDESLQAKPDVPDGWYVDRPNGTYPEIWNNKYTYANGDYVDESLQAKPDVPDGWYVDRPNGTYPEIWEGDYTYANGDDVEDPSLVVPGGPTGYYLPETFPAGGYHYTPVSINYALQGGGNSSGGKQLFKYNGENVAEVTLTLAGNGNAVTVAFTGGYDIKNAYISYGAAKVPLNLNTTPIVVTNQQITLPKNANETLTYTIELEANCWHEEDYYVETPVYKKMVLDLDHENTDHVTVYKKMVDDLDHENTDHVTVYKEMVSDLDHENTDHVTVYKEIIDVPHDIEIEVFAKYIGGEDVKEYVVEVMGEKDIEVTVPVYGTDPDQKLPLKVGLVEVGEARFLYKDNELHITFNLSPLIPIELQLSYAYDYSEDHTFVAEDFTIVEGDEVIISDYIPGDDLFMAVLCELPE